MNNIISNKKKEVPNLYLNDLDYITHFLIILKDLEKNMTVTLTEASNEKLYKFYKKVFDEVSKYQRETYELMFKYGWYTLEKASNTKIETECKKLKEELKVIDN